MQLKLPLDIQTQPTDSACGATCLQAIYNYWQDEIELSEIIQQIPEFETGGTLAVLLGCHALSRGYSATLYTYNLHVFDPTWFKSPAIDLREKLIAQKAHKGAEDFRLAAATQAYIRYLSMGGKIEMKPLERQLIKEHVTKNIPMLAGLSATFLYQEAREISQPPDEHGISSVPDDVAGKPCGHFVVISGYDEPGDAVLISDPLYPDPQLPAAHYWAAIDHVATAILLGIVTFDSNILVIQPNPNRTDLKHQ